MLDAQTLGTIVALAVRWYYPSHHQLPQFITLYVLSLTQSAQCTGRQLVLATVPYLEPGGSIGLHGNRLTTSKIDDFLSKLPN